MNKKIIPAIIAIAIIILAVGAYFLYGNNFSSLLSTLKKTQGTAQKKSEVKVVGGVPKLFLNGKEFDAGAVNVYYYPPQGENHGPAYGDEKWLTNMKALIDQAAGNNAKLILLNVWWSDLDKSTSRPQNIGDNIDFAPLDGVFSYAQQKGAYIIPIFALFPFDPDWWLKENNFTPYNKNKTCDFCETDSVGNVYQNSSINSDKVQQDFGAFVGAVVDHYKNNLALAGWDMGIGTTGEDGYGPNYITIKNPGNIANNPSIKSQPMMYTDYSPFFEREFEKWMKNKYKTDQALQTAWGDKSATLVSLKIPKPADMIKNGAQMPVFPDPTDIFAIAQIGTDGKENLTVKGLDFYEFRNEMRRKDREYYASLIKKNDPDHILLLNGASDNLFGQSSNFDGIAFSMSATIDKAEESRNYYLVADIAKRAAKYQKLAVISDEHTCDGMARTKTGECETSDELKFVENLGKGLRCAGGIFAPTIGYYGKEYLADKSLWIPPIWFSDKAMAAAKKVNDFEPTKNCGCSLAGEMYSENNCSTSSQPGCDWLGKTYESFCNVKVQNNKGSSIGGQGGQGNPNPSPAQNGNTSPSPNNSQSQGKCGDGICDEIEKANPSVCPQDCK